jgi:hypothetical protein
MNIIFVQDLSKGGEGSGNFGHEGRPGEVGGSMSDAYVSQNYKNTGYAFINQSLRSGKESDFSVHTQEQVRVLDRLTHSQKTSKEETVYRTVVGKRMLTQYSQVGKIVTDKAFMSVSSDRESSEMAVMDVLGTRRLANNFTLQIKVPAGSPYYDLQGASLENPISGRGQNDEKEWLFPRNSSLRILEVNTDDLLIQAELI